MRKILLIIIMIFLFSIIHAQKSDSLLHWASKGILSLNFSQVALSNWTGGGESSLALTSVTQLFADYSKERIYWENSLELAYGLLYTNAKGLQKTDDKMALTSKLGYNAKQKAGRISYSFLFNFRSQFTAGFNFPDDSTVISRFLSPGYILLSLGTTYKDKKKYFSFFAAPLTAKLTFVIDTGLANKGAYGVEPGKTLRTEIGAFINLNYKNETIKNVTLNTKISLFSNYLNNPQNIDINWEMLINMKVNKYISANITTNLIYDHDINIRVYKDLDGDGNKELAGEGPRTQIKEVLSIGLSLRF